MDAAAVTALLKLESLLAARAFQDETGHAAKSWSDLVPAYLPAIPKDPASNAPLLFQSIYQPTKPARAPRHHDQPPSGRG